MNLLQATEHWVNSFDFIPGQIFEDLIKLDESISYYDSDKLRLISSPYVSCINCDCQLEIDLSLSEIETYNKNCKDSDFQIGGMVKAIIPSNRKIYGKIIANADNLYVIEHKGENLTFSYKEIIEWNKNKITCENCQSDEFVKGFPIYAFPCGWGTLFSPKESLDQEWIEKNLENISKLGFFIFESEWFGNILGIDAGGFDFYETFWVPLYKLRGLQWHDEE